MKIGVGVSTQKNVASAAREIWDQAKSKIGKETIDLAILFTSVDLSTNSLLKVIKNNLGGSPLAGCSSQAIITNHGILRHAAALVLINCQGIDISAASIENIKARTALTAGEELGNKLLQGFRGSHRELGMFFCDGLIEEGSQLILGLQERLGRSFPIAGASASDNLNYYKTYLYFNREVISDAAVGILWGGKLKFGLGIRHGWKPLGKHRTVTKSYSNVIEKIDGKPAVSIYQDYFAKDTAELRKDLKYISTLYPIGIYLEGETEYLLRNILSIGDNGSLICQGDISVGSQIRLMIGTKESCLAAARQAVLDAKKGLAISRLGLEKKGSAADIVFVFDSASRYSLLKRNADQELRTIKEALQEEVPIVGFYTYGEQAPLKSINYHGQAHFHNQTVSILALGG
jgi:hypothetical protein